MAPNWLAFLLLFFFLSIFGIFNYLMEAMPWWFSWMGQIVHAQQNSENIGGPGKCHHCRVPPGRSRYRPHLRLCLEVYHGTTRHRWLQGDHHVEPSLGHPDTDSLWPLERMGRHSFHLQPNFFTFDFDLEKSGQIDIYDNYKSPYVPMQISINL